MDRLKAQWSSLLLDSMMLSMDSGRVIALRMATFAGGGSAAQAESHSMIDEKLRAVFDANVAATKSVMLGQAHLAPKRALRVYQNRVRKNLRRLGNG